MLKLMLLLIVLLIVSVMVYCRHAELGYGSLKYGYRPIYRPRDGDETRPVWSDRPLTAYCWWGKTVPVKICVGV